VNQNRKVIKIKYRALEIRRPSDINEKIQRAAMMKEYLEELEAKRKFMSLNRRKIGHIYNSILQQRISEYKYFKNTMIQLVSLIKLSKFGQLINYRFKVFSR